MRNLYENGIGLCLVLMMLACGQQQQEGKLTIAVIPKGTTHTFWKMVEAGAKKAGMDLGVDVIWVGPLKEDERQMQISIVDNQVINEVSGIALAPLDETALRRPVQAAFRKKIPVIIFDSALNEADEFTVSFVATDNFAGGRIAARELAGLLGGQGKIVMLRYQEGSASTEKREAGFLQAMQEFPGIELVSTEQYAGATTATALQASENLLLRFKDNAGRLTIDGIFCPNESSTFGMLQALRRSRLAGKVMFVGFDSSDPLLEALEQSQISGLVVQNPLKMGYLAVKTMVDHLRGLEIERRIDTGVNFVTKENLLQPDIQELVKPDIEKWLN
jgi:ribose transport system substrate-binding protein